MPPMESNTLRPLLYSYRRCPYAMRARMALRAAGIECNTVEIDLRNKPEHLLSVSPKATVPVLCVNDQLVIDESLEIMIWALRQNDPDNWLDGLANPVAQRMLTQNDGPFKLALDQYKYASRFPALDYRQSRKKAMEELIDPLACILQAQPFIGGQSPVFQDIAIFPFVRQFAGVEPGWFEESVPASVKRWLEHWLASDIFRSIMRKPAVSQAVPPSRPT